MARRMLACVFGMKTTIVVLALALLALFPGAARAQNFGPVGPPFRLEWSVDRSKAGEPMVSGYVYNLRRCSAVNVKLLVEALDGTGRTVAERTVGVHGEVTPGGRQYFEVVAPGGGADYRLTVRTADFAHRGGF